MSLEVKWTDLAIRDVQEYIKWIKNDSDFHAARVARAIFELADDIPRRPLMGHIVPELKNESLRFKLIFGRRLIYEIRPDLIVIKRVISCKMDFIREYNIAIDDFA